MKNEINKLDSIKNKALSNKTEINKILSSQGYPIKKYSDLPANIQKARKGSKDFAILNVNIKNAPLAGKEVKLTIPLNLAFDPKIILLSIYKQNDRSSRDDCFLIIRNTGEEYLIEHGTYGRAHQGFSVYSFDKNNLVLKSSPSGGTRNFNFDTIIAIG